MTDAQIRARIEIAVGMHLRPGPETPPHPDEIAIVDDVMAVIEDVLPDDLLRSSCDAVPAAAGTLATLIVGVTAAACSHCRTPAFPHEETHEHQAGYGRSPGRGCGARFASITTPYRMDDDWRRALTEMRRDLPIVDYLKALKGDSDA